MSSVYGSKFAAFAHGQVSDYVHLRDRLIAERIQGLSDDELFGQDESQLVTSLAQQSSIRPPVLDFDRKSTRLAPIGEVGSAGFPRGSAPKQAIEYTLPLPKGSAPLLQYAPNGSVQLIGYNTTPEVIARQGADEDVIVFYILDYGDASGVIQAAKTVLDNLRINSTSLCQQLENVNGGVASEVQSAITREKQRRENERKRNDDLLSRLP